MHQYWQVAAGNNCRDYSALFLKHGLAFVGGETQINLAAEVQKGDVILLKDGTNKILAAGIVVERNGRTGGCHDKKWILDVEGWGLPAYVFVDWRSAKGTITPAGLNRSTISRTNSTTHHEIADALLNSPILPVEPEPEAPTVLPYSAILADLKERNSAINTDQGLAVLENIRRVYTEEFAEAMLWTAEQTAEDLVKPLLQTLGWRPADLKDKVPGAGLKNVVCCFPGAQRNANQDVKIVDVRKFYDGLDLSPEQAARIGKVFTGAKALAVTNGVALKLYSKSEAGPFKTEPSAYANLARPAERCPSDPRIHGVLTALRFLVKPV